MEKWKTLHHLESPLEGDSAQSDFIKRLFQKSHIKERERAYQSMRRHRTVSEANVLGCRNLQHQMCGSIHN